MPLTGPFIAPTTKSFVSDGSASYISLGTPLTPCASPTRTRVLTSGERVLNIAAGMPLTGASTMVSTFNIIFCWMFFYIRIEKIKFKHK